MKKILSVTLILLVMCVSGCGNKKTAEQPAPIEQSIPTEPEKIDAVLIAGSFWVADSENMKYLADALVRDDVEYLKQLMLEGKIFQVDRDTKVVRFGVAANEHCVLISFKEGRYTNKSGCAFKASVYNEEEYQNYLEEKRKEEERREQENMRRQQERQTRLEKERQEKIAQEQAKKDATKQETLLLIQNYLTNTDNYFDAIIAGNVEEVKQVWNWINVEQYKIIALKNNQSIDSDIRECAKKAHRIVLDRCAVIVSYLNYKVKNEKEYRKAEQARQEFRNKYGY